MSPAVDNAEWDARIALNDYLQGINRSAFIAKQEADLRLTNWGLWVRDVKKLDERIQSRQQYYDEILANPIIAFKKFQVKYVALPKNTQQPQYLNFGWKLFKMDHIARFGKINFKTDRKSLFTEIIRYLRSLQPVNKQFTRFSNAIPRIIYL